MSGGGACACRSERLREVAQRSRHNHERCFWDAWVPIPHLPLCNPEGGGQRLQGPPGEGPRPLLPPHCPPSSLLQAADPGAFPGDPKNKSRTIVGSRATF